MGATLNELVCKLTSPRTMMAAEEQFLSAGADAVPVLAAIFSGESKNEFGVPYRQLGLPLRCAMEIACRLGPVAKPLEPYMREEVKAGSWVAASALRRMPPLEEGTIEALADALDADDPDLTYEAARTLMEQRLAEHPAVRNRLAASPIAERVWRSVKSRETGQP